MSAVDEILAAINPEQLAAAIGTDQDTAMSAAAAAIPTLINSLQANSGTAAGASGLAEALGQHANDLFGDAVDLGSVDTDDGRKIVQHALADDPQRLQALGGFGGSLLSKLLPLLAPIVMSYLAKKLGLGGSSSSGGGDILGDLLGGLLGGGTQQQGSGGGLGDLLGSILGGSTGASADAGGAGGLGDILGDLLGGGAEPATVPAGGGIDTSGQVFSTQDASGNIQIPTDTQPTYQQPSQQQQQPGGDILGDLLGQILGR